MDSCADFTVGNISERKEQMMTQISNPRKRNGAAGYTMMEIAITVAILIILIAFAVPSLLSTIKVFRLGAAVESATSAIQTTRFQAIMQGYPFQLTFSAANNTFQVASEPMGAASFTNVGGAIPLSGSPITLSAGTVLQFKPNGSISATAGNSETFQITYTGRTKTITVSNYGSVTVQ
jgi:Tfp pilus assembly protein FimT